MGCKESLGLGVLGAGVICGWGCLGLQGARGYGVLRAGGARGWGCPGQRVLGAAGSLGLGVKNLTNTAAFPPLSQQALFGEVQGLSLQAEAASACCCTLGPGETGPPSHQASPRGR